jgi:hypothetical protein
MNCGIATGWGWDRSWVSVAIGSVVQEGVVETVPAANRPKQRLNATGKNRLPPLALLQDMLALNLKLLASLEGTLVPVA